MTAGFRSKNICLQAAFAGPSGDAYLCGVPTRRNPGLLLALPLLGACASAGGEPAAPLVWPPGVYYLEATIDYQGGTGRKRDLYSADLYVREDQQLRIDSHFSTCMEPTTEELRRDARRRLRTFRCGDALLELRPGGDTVTGRIQVVVQEEYGEQVCVERNAQGACTRTVTTIRTRPVRKTASLRVETRDPTP